MMFEGVMHHVDSTGFREGLPTGSTQNMVAGSGIQHGGDMAAGPARTSWYWRGIRSGNRLRWVAPG